MTLVAVVDDEESVRRGLGRLLRGAGYEVAMFAGGAEFLESLSRARPACVLVDGSMPGMDGREVLERLSRLPERVPAVVVSGRGSAADREAAAALGAVAFLAKPFYPEDLLKAVAAAVVRPSAGTGRLEQGRTGTGSGVLCLDPRRVRRPFGSASTTVVIDDAGC